MNLHSSNPMTKEKAGSNQPAQEPALSPEQTEEVREVFNLFDKDGVQTISIEQLGTVMRALGQYPTEQQLDKLKAELQADGSEIIKFPQLVALIAHQRRGTWGLQGSDDELRAAFQVFEQGEDDGLLRAAELRKALTTVGERLTEEEVEVMMREFPSDGDGMVRFEDFVQTLNHG